MIAEVIVDIAHSDVDKIFDYDCLNKNVQVGSRVVVPFGSMKIEGVVIGLKDKSEFESSRLKSIVRIIDETPAICEEGIALMRFMCDKYHIPCALALRQFLPSEMRKGKVRVKLIRFAKITDDIDVFEIINSLPSNAKAQKAVLEYLSDGKMVKVAELPVGHVLVMSGEGMELGGWFPATNRTLSIPLSRTRLPHL